MDGVCVDLRTTYKIVFGDMNRINGRYNYFIIQISVNTTIINTYVNTYFIYQL